MRAYLKWRQDLCLGFHTGVTLLCNLAYAVTEGARDTAVPIVTLRWHVSRLMRGERPELAFLEPNHVKVHEVVDDTFATRAFVCVAHELTADVGDDGASTASNDAEYHGTSDEHGVIHHCLRQSCHVQAVKADLAATPRPAAVLGKDVEWDPAPPGYKWRAVAAVIVFTGTETLSLFLSKHIHFSGDDAKAGATLDPTTDGLKGGAHGAWLTMLRGMHGSLTEGLQDANGSLTWLQDPGEVWILGHSMGGALATLAAPFVVQLAQKQSEVTGVTTPPNVKLSTIASPRVLNEEAVACFSDLGSIRVQRFVLAEDVVPSLPPKHWGFKHIGFERRLRTPGIVRTWSNLVTSPYAALLAHGVKSYRRPLEEAESKPAEGLSRAYADV